MAMRFKRVASLKISKGISVMSVAADPKTVFVANSMRCVVALEPSTYSLRWSLPLRDVDAVACVNGDLLANGRSQIILVDATSGKVRWSAPAVHGPSLWEGTILAWSSEGRGVTRHDSTTGRVIESISLPAPRACQPCGDIVPLLDYDEARRPMDPVRGFNLRTKRVEWGAALLDALWSGGPAPASEERPGIRTAGEHLFLTTPRRFMGINARTGAPSWHTTMPEAVDVFPYVACGRAFVGNWDRFYGLCLGDGRIEFSRSLAELGAESPMLCVEHGEHVAVPIRGAVIFIRPDSGDVVAEYRGAVDVPHSVNGDLVMLGTYGEVRVLRQIAEQPGR